MKKSALLFPALLISLVACGGGSPAQHEAELAGHSDASQLRQDISEESAHDFCVSFGATYRDQQQMNGSVPEAQLDGTVQPYIDGCMQGYHDSRL